MTLLLTVLVCFNVIRSHSQEKEYSFSVQPYSVHLLERTERESLLSSLDKFLMLKNGPYENNPLIHPDYLKANSNPFSWFANIEREGDNSSFYKPTLLAILPIISGEEYLVKLSYLGVTAGGEPKHKATCSFLVKKIDGGYFFYNSLSYNTRNWNVKQIGSINYTFSNKLDSVKAIQMDNFNKSFAKKFSIEPISVRYFKCEDPEQLFKIIGFDYIGNMYLSTSGGIAEQWHNTLFAGNNSEWYPHEIVHFYTAKLFPENNRIVNEGYATFMGGTGGYSLEAAKEFAKKYLLEHPQADLLRMFVDFERIDHAIPFSYIISGLICQDIEARLGLKKIEELFKAGPNEKDYFVQLQKITGITKVQFPDYVRRLLDN